ncbi:hypothetical protein C1645_831610 [Glomus cerebriforme]|uniref:Uncharacterized protein n=1 Tax=Glomus cerebriforme TaxID=658196 RepID=A0A397SJ16_9GLOM|nr:hypothetical protein C1645_831610 [Glomus cerebriforme]
MHNFPLELSLNDTPVQQMSTTLRRQRRASFTTTSLVKYDNVVGVSGKNKKLTTLFVQEYQEEEEEEEKQQVVENNCPPIEDLIRQLQSELQQTRALVAELETRLELTEQTSQVIVGELKHLLSENESESHTTAVEIEEIDQESDKGDDMKLDLDDDEFYISSSLMNQTYQEEIEEIPSINDEREVTSPKLSSQIESTTTMSTSSSESSIIQHADDNDSFNRICSALQNLINDGQVALQKPNSSSSNQLLGLPQTTTRPRAQSWSSNVSNWIMNHYNPSPMMCECGSCWLCLESSGSSLSSTTKTTPKSSRANSMSSAQHSSLSLTSQQRESYNRQVNLAGIKKQYRKKLESRFDYRKSCDDLEMELQKLISTAISTGMEHGLMHSPIYRQYSECMERDDSTSDSYFTHQDKSHHYNYFRNRDDETSDESYDENGEEKFSRFPTSFPKSFEIFCEREQFKELENAILNDNNNDSKKGSSKWRRRIWNYLQKIGLKFNNNDDNNNNKENYNKNLDDDNEDEGYDSYKSYSSYNSSWKSSSRDEQENLNDEYSSNPFPSSFINTLNIGQNINFNVNLINSTTNNITTNFNEIDNSIHTTSTTNNNYNCDNTTINNYEEKSSQSQLNITKGDFASKKFQSLASKCTNFLAMIGLMISMSQTIATTKSVTPTLMRIAARNIIRSRAKGRRSGRDMILMIKVIKYVTVLFVGWAAGRIGKKQKESSDENNRITEIPSNN